MDDDQDSDGSWETDSADNIECDERAKCLFSNYVLSSSAAALEHDKTHSGFDFAKYAAQVGPFPHPNSCAADHHCMPIAAGAIDEPCMQAHMDEYDVIRCINWIRGSVSQGRDPRSDLAGALSTPEKPWSDDKYLIPVLPTDPLLFHDFGFASEPSPCAAASRYAQHASDYHSNERSSPPPLTSAFMSCHDLMQQTFSISPIKLTCLCRPAEPAHASSKGAAAELQRLRQEAADLQLQNAELRSALQEACMSALPPEAAQYVQVWDITALCTLCLSCLSPHKACNAEFWHSDHFAHAGQHARQASRPCCRHLQLTKGRVICAAAAYQANGRTADEAEVLRCTWIGILGCLLRHTVHL